MGLKDRFCIGVLISIVIATIGVSIALFVQGHHIQLAEAKA